MQIDSQIRTTFTALRAFQILIKVHQFHSLG